MYKGMFIIVLVTVFALPVHAGENRDKRKAKQEAYMQEQREHERQAMQERNRDMRAEDELYKEIELQERLLSKLRRKLEYMHEENLRKYSSRSGSSTEHHEYDHQYR